MNLTVYDREAIQSALYDLFANRTTRGEVEDALIDGDYNDAALLVAAAIYRISTEPQLPAAANDPQRSGGTAAGVPIEALAALAGQTP